MLEIIIQKQIRDIEININFSSNIQGITALYGKSGAGKTSIINMIAGLVTPDKGKISIGNKELYNSKKGINIPIHKRHIGYVFQDARLFPNMSVEKNLLYGSKRKSNNMYLSDFSKVIDLLGISNLLTRYPLKLSGGEKQRIAIGRALLSNPEILLMDEPLASLDKKRGKELINYIEMIPFNFKIPVIYVTHSIDEIRRIADNVAIIDKGKLIQFGTIKETLDKEIELLLESKVHSYNPATGISEICINNINIPVNIGKSKVGSTINIKIDIGS